MVPRLVVRVLLGESSARHVFAEGEVVEFEAEGGAD